MLFEILFLGYTMRQISIIFSAEKYSFSTIKIRNTTWNFTTTRPKLNNSGIFMVCVIASAYYNFLPQFSLMQTIKVYIIYLMVNKMLGSILLNIKKAMNSK